MGVLSGVVYRTNSKETRTERWGYAIEIIMWERRTTRAADTEKAR